MNLKYIKYVMLKEFSFLIWKSSTLTFLSQSKNSLLTINKGKNRKRSWRKNRKKKLRQIKNSIFRFCRFGYSLHCVDKTLPWRNLMLSSFCPFYSSHDPVLLNGAAHTKVALLSSDKLTVIIPQMHDHQLISLVFLDLVMLSINIDHQKLTPLLTCPWNTSFSATIFHYLLHLIMDISKLKST